MTHTQKIREMAREWHRTANACFAQGFIREGFGHILRAQACERLLRKYARLAGGAAS